MTDTNADMKNDINLIDPASIPVSSSPVLSSTETVVNKTEMDKIKKLIERSQDSLAEARELLRKIVEKRSYKDVPGVEGTFDGVDMIDKDGTRHEVPANYAAKSRIVFGDRLKLIEEDGKQLFKQIEKVRRKALTGIMSKKEGKWYVLTDTNSYQISDRAAEFNALQINDKVEVMVPDANLNVPFASLEKVLKPATPARAAVITTSPALKS
jgi:hypothetical protein